MRRRCLAALLLLAFAAGCAAAEIGMEAADAGVDTPAGADRPRPVEADGASAADAATPQADAATPQADAAPDTTAPVTDGGGPDDAGGDASGDAGGSPVVIAGFLFDFEAGWQGWMTGILSGGGCEDSNEWECGTPSSVYWPTACAGGTGCLATDLDDHYNYNECSFAMSPAVDLTAYVGTSVCLQFDLAYDFVVMYGECSDGCVVQVNDTDDPSGDNWVTVTPDGGYPYPMPTSHHLPANQSAFCGTADWATYTVPVEDALKKAAFRVRFYMDNGQVVSHFGAYVDNVRLVECN